MKKLLLLSVVGVFSLSSFTVKTKNFKKNPSEYTFRCSSGVYVTFQCGYCDNQQANELASIYCGS